LVERSVVVAIATRGRPEGCRRVVEAVKRQQVRDGIGLRILVVDNAPQRENLEVPAEVEVLHEPRAGIPHARNRAVEYVTNDADVLVFIDDDEEPAHAHWLQRLLDGLEVYDCDMATGPIRSRHDLGSPAWACAHPVFNRPRFTTGTQRPEAYSGNLAIRTDVFRRLGRWFHPQLSTTGGSDTEFTRRAVREGATIVWVDEAGVVEHVPAHRATLRWIFRRSLRIGANRIQRLRIEQRGVGSYVLYLGGAIAEMVGGTAVALLVPLVGRRRAAIGLGRAARGIGTWFAMVRGRGVEEYRTVT
jgi:succinoglycan biosynthesis protein ExoM